MQMHGFPGSLPQLHVDDLDEERERHREVDVALRDVQVEAFGDEARSDKEQEAECKHLHRWMLLDKAADLPGKKHHEPDGDHHGGNHYADIVSHADGGNDGVE